MTDAVYLPQFEPKVAAIAKKAKVFLITDACRSGNLAGQNNGALRTMKAINDGFVNSTKILSCEPGHSGKTLSRRRTWCVYLLFA